MSEEPPLERNKRSKHSVIDAARHYQERVVIFEADHPQPGGIVFLGSSHLEWFDTDMLLPGRYIVNRGIAGDRLGLGDCGVLRRLDVSVFNCAPSFVLFQNGINDIGELARTGKPAFEDILACYEKVVVAIRSRLPDVPMCCVNEMPTTGSFANCLPHVPPFNEHIARVAHSHGCLREDVYSLVVGANGHLRADLTYDGLHLNEKGYRLWAKHLDAILRV